METSNVFGKLLGATSVHVQKGIVTVPGLDVGLINERGSHRVVDQVFALAKQGSPELVGLFVDVVHATLPRRRRRKQHHVAMSHQGIDEYFRR